MATIESLVDQITDAALRARVSREVAELKKRLDWGLVFERHLPENTRVLSAPIKVGTAVWERGSTSPRRFRVRGIEADELVVASEEPNTTASEDVPTERIARSDVLVEQDFAQPVFPTFTPIGELRAGPEERPAHVVIEGENFHAIEAMLTVYEGQADVLYLDPPYNTGNRDWSYNNDYVDPNDRYRPSKWLAFMERRLRVARRLLRRDGVMIITVDENEVHHLGMLLEQLFPGTLQQMVTIVINPKGTGKANFARVDEYAFFVMPNLGRSVIRGLPKATEETTPEGGETEVLDAIDAGEEGEQAEFEDQGDGEVEEDDDEEEEEQEAEAALPFPPEERDQWELRHARRRGGESSYRHQRPNQFYPIWIDPEQRRVLRAGDALPLEQDEPDTAAVDGLTPVWPIDKEGNQRCWRFVPESMNALIEANRVALGRQNPQTGTWTINYWVRSTSEKKPKTVWWEKAYDAGTHGTTLLNTFLASRGAFSFPKSVYAVRDALAMVVRDRPNALIVDFFAGSGTTLHSTLLLNRQYGGQRRCVLVTNNEVNYKVARRLNRAGHFRGDAEFEAAGVFESATRPRVTAAITGKTPAGDPVPGTYLDGRPFAEGFEENVEFFRIDYLDPAEVQFGLRFGELHPLLWLTAGGIGPREDLDPSSSLGLPAASPYAVLFDPAGMPQLLAALGDRRDITHIFIVADSAEAYSQLASELPQGLRTVRLYHDYTETLRRVAR